MNGKAFVQLLGERQKQIERDLYTFGEPSGEDVEVARASGMS